MHIIMLPWPSPVGSATWHARTLTNNNAGTHALSHGAFINARQHCWHARPFTRQHHHALMSWVDRHIIMLSYYHVRSGFTPLLFGLCVNRRLVIIRRTNNYGLICMLSSSCEFERHIGMLSSSAYHLVSPKDTSVCYYDSCHLIV
jgi:hypothetical protein